MKSWHHLAVLGVLCILTMYSLYSYPKLLDTLSQGSHQDRFFELSLLTPKVRSRISNTQTSADSVPYSPCHYPVHDAPRYSMGDEALATCIASLKTAAAEAATKWPRDAVSTMNGKGKYYKTQIINFILPTWLCPTEERIGGFTNDGAKWVCAPRLFLNKNEDCYVYSFGSNANFEFEDYLARIAQCQTHIFDPTPGVQDKLQHITLPHHYHFHFEAFGGQINKQLVIAPFGEQKKQGVKPQTFQTKTLDEFVSELHTPFLDILKIDVDGSELNDIFNTDTDSIWTTNRIGQVFIEIHMDFEDETTFQKMFKLYDFLVSNGFVLFHSEWNVHAIYAYEVAFINLDYKSPSSSLTYLERLLTEPYTISEENAVDLSDSASLMMFLDGESRRGWPTHFSYMVPEATYHCHNKVFVGNRSDLQKYFMYLCVDSLNQASTYVGIYESKDVLNGSSVEEALKSNPLFSKDVTTTFSPSSSSPSERLDTIAAALRQFDVVKIDLPNMLTTLSLSRVDSQRLLALSTAKIIHVELHVCDHTDYFDLRDRFIKLMQLFQYYGYEIYHKEVTFIENLKQEVAGDDSSTCHLAVSWIKRT